MLKINLKEKQKQYMLKQKKSQIDFGQKQYEKCLFMNNYLFL